jgi:hypothetical protein
MLFNIFKKAQQSIFCDPSSFLYIPNFNINENPGISKLETLLETYNINIITPTICIEDAIISYVVSLGLLLKSKEILKDVVKFCILLRSYLNTVGWDYIRQFVKFCINIPYDYTGSFVEKNNCFYVPELIDDFVSTFMKMDEGFYINEKRLIAFSKLFCNWLYVNNLTCLKLLNN